MQTRLIVIVLFVITALGCNASPIAPTTSNVPTSTSLEGADSTNPIDATGLRDVSIPAAVATTGCRRYSLVVGSFTQAQAHTEATKRGGHALVLSSPEEFQLVVRCFALPRPFAIHTGHRQEDTRSEPAGGWKTITREPGYWPWNGKGPDDGCKKRFDWAFVEGGLQIGYGPACKNENAAVIWTNSGGRLEDVSVNHRGSVIVEYE